MRTRGEGPRGDWVPGCFGCFVRRKDRTSQITRWATRVVRTRFAFAKAEESWFGVLAHVPVTTA